MSAFVTDYGLGSLAWSPSASMQFGTGSGQDVTDTQLNTPVQGQVAAVTSRETTNVSGDTIRNTATITADVDRVITEVGLFDATPSMEVYGDFDAINLAQGDSIVFQINVVVARAA